MRSGHIFQTGKKEMAREVSKMQCDIPAQRKSEEADEARLSMCIQQVEVNGLGLQGPLGTRNTPIRPEIRSWVFERQVALENKANKRSEKI